MWQVEDWLGILSWLDCKFSRQLIRLTKPCKGSIHLLSLFSSCTIGDVIKNICTDGVDWIFLANPAPNRNQRRVSWGEIINNNNEYLPDYGILFFLNVKTLGEKTLFRLFPCSCMKKSNNVHFMDYCSSSHLFDLLIV
jgi:hypothetical protein